MSIKLFCFALSLYTASFIGSLVTVGIVSYLLFVMYIMLSVVVIWGVWNLNFPKSGRRNDE